MEHHADFAVPVTRHLVVETGCGPDDGHGPLRGDVIALGWWVDPTSAPAPDAADPEAAGAAGHTPTGTLYLVVDPRRSRPYWVKQADLRSVRLADPSGSVGHPTRQ
jgi:hypothetical protein